MKKKIKIVIIIFLAVTLIPLLFFNKGSAEGMSGSGTSPDTPSPTPTEIITPTPTPDLPIPDPPDSDYDLEIVDSDTIGTQDLLTFDYFNEIRNGTSELGVMGQLTFNMAYEVGYINNFLQATKDGTLSTQNFTTLELLLFHQQYELCWLHLILEFGVSMFIASGFYKFLKY